MIVSMVGRARKKEAWKSAVEVASAFNTALAAAIALGYVPVSPVLLVFLYATLWSNIFFGAVYLFFFLAELTILGNPDRRS